MDNNNYEWAPGDPGKPKKNKQPSFKKLGTTFAIVALVLILLLGGLTCFYTVNDKQQAVVTTFGMVTDVVDAGVHSSCPSESSRYTRWT